jgi:hypothetical protein
MAAPNNQTTDQTCNEKVDWQYPFRFYPYGGRHTSGLVWGIFLIIIGVVFLLKNFGLFPYDIGQLWPIALIVPGIFIILNHRK